MKKISKKYFTNSKKNGMIKSLNSRESTAVRSKNDSYLINNKCYIYLMIFLKPFDGLFTVLILVYQSIKYMLHMWNIDKNI